jgi:hypothetical protein
MLPQVKLGVHVVVAGNRPNNHSSHKPRPYNSPALSDDLRGQKCERGSEGIWGWEGERQP